MVRAEGDDRRPRAPRRSPRDGQDPPDPRAPRGDRPPGLRRPGLRRRRRSRARAPVPARAPAPLRAPVHGPRSTSRSELPSRSARRRSPSRASDRLVDVRYHARVVHVPLTRRSAGTVVPRLRASEPGSDPARRSTTSENHTKGAGPVGSRLHEGAAGGWSSLRPSDTSLEPEDEAFHLHRAWRHLHHRPAADAAARRRMHTTLRGTSPSANGTILFVGTKKQAQDAVRTEAERVGMPYVSNRWLGGLLTNWRTISDRIAYLHDLRRLQERRPARAAAGEGAHHDAETSSRSSSRTSAASPT